MGLFKRRHAESVDAEVVDDNALEAESEAGSESGESLSESVSRAVAFDRSTGPWDESESDRASTEFPRLDLGAMQIPGLPGISLQLEADPQTQAVMAVTAVKDDGAVQLQAFAAPRSEGIWDEIRAEMFEEISASKAQIEESEGAFGTELRAVLPGQAPDGTSILQPVRFTGIDGPRWFLRAVFLGRAAVEPDPSDELHVLVRETIVVRGVEAMAPKDQLALHMPITDGEVVPDEVDDQDDEVDLNPFERGPEITEIR